MALADATHRRHASAPRRYSTGRLDPVHRLAIVLVGLAYADAGQIDIGDNKYTSSLIGLDKAPSRSSSPMLGLQVVVGFTGQVALGQSFFFGTGAYLAAWLVQDQHWPWLPRSWWWFPCASLWASWWVSQRCGSKGLYLALVTLGLAAIFPLSCSSTACRVHQRRGRQEGRLRSCARRTGCRSTASPGRLQKVPLLRPVLRRRRPLRQGGGPHLEVSSVRRHRRRLLLDGVEHHQEPARPSHPGHPRQRDERRRSLASTCRCTRRCRSASSSALGGVGGIVYVAELGIASPGDFPDCSRSTSSSVSSSAASARCRAPSSVGSSSRSCPNGRRRPPRCRAFRNDGCRARPASLDPRADADPAHVLPARRHRRRRPQAQVCASSWFLGCWPRCSPAERAGRRRGGRRRRTTSRTGADARPTDHRTEDEPAGLGDRRADAPAPELTTATTTKRGEVHAIITTMEAVSAGVMAFGLVRRRVRSDDDDGSRPTRRPHRRPAAPEATEAATTRHRRARRPLSRPKRRSPPRRRRRPKLRRRARNPLARSSRLEGQVEVAAGTVSTSTPAPTTGAPTQGVDGDEIRIGMTLPQSGQLAVVRTDRRRHGVLLRLHQRDRSDRRQEPRARHQATTATRPAVRWRTSRRCSTPRTSSPSPTSSAHRSTSATRDDHR